jgi:hypothetical protein
LHFNPFVLFIINSKRKILSMKNLILLLYCFLIAGMQLSQAQGVAITGKTTDQATGEPFPGVTIMVRGTTVGTTSLADGTYSLPVPAGGTALVFSFVGYQTQEVAILYELLSALNETHREDKNRQ